MGDSAENQAPDLQRQKAVWIASYPKSGNTWVRVFLHNLLRELRAQSEGVQDINWVPLPASDPSLTSDVSRPNPSVSRSDDRIFHKQTVQQRSGWRAASTGTGHLETKSDTWGRRIF